MSISIGICKSCTQNTCIGIEVKRQYRPSLAAAAKGSNDATYSLACAFPCRRVDAGARIFSPPHAVYRLNTPRHEERRGL